ncbi:serine/threonine-protein kinase [Microbulbifer rhizosphaerae]|uniref:Serine/threonine-protein kinase n=1 Tax=Microbulbifer rhizosphaerae TaxID=1562603 RepID=A0A7W4W895_9GAMM|nr:serine/threonine-protein kinase [Microbulbifer rhizosphaerae]MBB3059555.1 serine/threonine-protein kinase [Microbulbifer rhizosphaerae]
MDPTSVAGYRVVERIGRGGMGVVYRARDSVLDRDVALKYVDSAGAPEGRVERLIREAKIASSLQHPGIVTIYGFVSEGPCIAMEYIRGDTLSAHLLPDGMALDKAVRLGLQIAEALHYAHQSGVIHADLKPSNIMIDLTGRAKVLDFGLAHWRLFEELQTISDSGEHLQQLAGTIPYMSPEVVMGRSLDCRSDIFSLGCVLFEMLTGLRPFSADNPAATLNSLLNRMPRGIEILHQKVPAALADLVLRMLEKDPSRRLPTLGDAIVVLRDFCDGVDVLRLRTKHRFLSVSAIRRGLPLLFTVFLGLLMYLISEPGVSGRQLRVFLAQPEYYREGEDTPMDTVIWSSVVNGLHLLGSIQPILYHRLPVEGSDPAQLAKLAGSDEWINVRFQPENPLGNVQLQRIRTGDGALLKQVQFSVPKEYLSQSSQAVLSQVLAIYRGMESRQSIGYSALSYSDYSRFVEIYSSLNQGVGDRQVLFNKLDKLISEAPGFFAAEVMAVDLAHDLFSDTEKMFYLERAKNIIGRLQFAHPNPVVVLQRKALLSIDSGDIEIAEEIVNKISSMSPGDPEVLLLRSRIAEHRGDISKALSLVTKASSMASISWSAWYRAAALAIRNGDVDTARDKVDKILNLTPGNTLALGQRGLVELLYGDVDRAVSIYKRLLEIKRHRSYLVNLGLALMLKENYQEARVNFTYALEIQPGHRVAILNLADAEMALGNREIALDLYRSVLNQKKPRGDEGAYGKMVRAQCLAHLEEYGMAIELTLEALSSSPEDPEIAYQAALVYSLVGEYESAIVNARAALRRGMDRRWFNLPVFRNTPVPDSLPENNENH